MIFLDFDGVLFDTVKEAYSVAVITSDKFNSIDQINFKTEHYQNFRKLRYLISPAWNYKYLLEVLELDCDINTMKNHLLKSITSASKKEYEEFESIFFITRNHLIKNYYDKWSKLNIPFSFLNKINFLFGDFKDKVYIITTKDKATVLKLLAFEGIEFNKKRIYDKEDYSKLGNKRKIIENIILQDKKSIFIDDSEKHIMDCMQINGLKCFQPDWGYIGIDSNSAVSQNEILIEINSLLGKK
jgi:hypothetical protein